MEFEELKSKVEKAIKLFFKHDSFLIEKNINERSITHKLAEYLQLEFSEYHVDCEYNKMTENSDSVKKTLLNIGNTNIKLDDMEAKTVYPDIIIHNRKNSKDNLLVIEAKKKINANGEDANFDVRKIKEYIKQIGYKNGLFIKIGDNYDSTVKNSIWYDETGKERKGRKNKNYE